MCIINVVTASTVGKLRKLRLTAVHGLCIVACWLSVRCGRAEDNGARSHIDFVPRRYCVEARE